jgi:DNA polymerase III epsilon subunit-like protein
MNYIVFDLEFNQDLPSLCLPDEAVTQCPFEIIQIGAIKLDLAFHTVATFDRYIKPTIYRQISTFVTDLTGIRKERLSLEAPFPQVFNDYIDFIGDTDTVFCVWGTSDMKELYRNSSFHKLEKKRIPDMFINIQPYVSAHLNISNNKLLSLEAAIKELEVLTPYPFHNAFYDAFYTAEIFKKIKSPLIQPKRYIPDSAPSRPRQPKKIIDFEKLLQQFEKMYQRELSEEEKAMITLAYKMGKTNQFVQYDSEPKPPS